MSADHPRQRLLHYAQARRALPGPNYTTVLEWIHRSLRPETYVEIGVQNGDSLRVAGPDTRCIGIDPEPTITVPLPANTRLFPLTSDEFFATHDLAAVLGCDRFALAFIDGLHTFEQALLDFINLEQFSSPGSVVLLHDCIPLDRETSERTRTTDFYSGDVWKLALCLREQRHDLRIVTVPTGPTGLCVVDGLNRRATSRQQYDAWVARYIGLDFEDYRMHLFRMPPAIPNMRDAVVAHLAPIRLR